MPEVETVTRRGESVSTRISRAPSHAVGIQERLPHPHEDDAQAFRRRGRRRPAPRRAARGSRRRSGSARRRAAPSRRRRSPPRSRSATRGRPCTSPSGGVLRGAGPRRPPAPGARHGARVLELVDLRARELAGHEDRLDERAVGEAQAVLAAAVGRLLAAHDLGQARAAPRRARRSRRLPGAPPSRGSPRTARPPVQRVEDLPAAVARLLPAPGRSRSQAGAVEPEGIRKKGHRASLCRAPPRAAAGAAARGSAARSGGTTRREPAPRAARARRARTLRVGSIPTDFRKRRSLTLIRNVARSPLTSGSGSSSSSRRPLPAVAVAVHAHLRVENHVEVVALFADLLDRVVHAPGAGDRFVDRLAQLLEHLRGGGRSVPCARRLSPPLSKSVKDAFRSHLVLS